MDVGHLSLTRRVAFSAVHRYQRAEWSEARNAEAFGERDRREFHRHDYVCHVTVSGTLDAATGMIVDLRALDEVLRHEVVERFDGRNLNQEIAEFADGRDVPTGENLARLIAASVQTALDARVGLHVPVTEVTVAEDPTLSVSWRATER